VSKAKDALQYLIPTPSTGWSRTRADGYSILRDRKGEAGLAFAESVARGLEDRPRWLDCRYLYDQAGSEIYEMITEQPEYYPTRTEASILADQAGRIRELVGDVTVVELGSGSSAKTLHVLDAWCARTPARYVPIDISGSALEAACESLARSYADLTVEGLAASYDRGLGLSSHLSPLMLMFLGSTVGNFNNQELDGFLEMISAQLRKDDFFLLGIDLVKDPERLEAAYNDAAGWTERFTKNLFAHMNRSLGTAVPLDAIEHVAYYNDSLQRIEIYARFRRQVTIELPTIGRQFRIAAGEMVLVEISRKFKAQEVAANAARFGFSLEKYFEDPDALFGLLLLRRRAIAPVLQDRKQRIAARFMHTRSRTLELIAPLRNPTADWVSEQEAAAVLSELEAIRRFEEDWLVSALESGSRSTRSDHLDLHSGESRAAEISGPVALPYGSLDGALAALERTRSAATQLLLESSLDPTSPLTIRGHIYQVATQNEAWRQELILGALHEGQVPTYSVPGEGFPPARPDQSIAGQRILIPAGEFLMGTDDRERALDAERPRHLVDLPDYWIDVAPVTQAEFQRFVEAGGYQKRDHWGKRGWQWCRECGRESPRDWRYLNGQWHVRAFGKDRPIDPLRPVSGVNLFEAAAFASWAGKRLPSELEWEKAAAWDADRLEARTFPWGENRPTADLGNLDQEQMEPAPVGSYPRGRSFYGCQQMLGDVWEWTSSALLPYPGFIDRLRGESLRAFSDDLWVLRGGSWATPAWAVRNTRRASCRPESAPVCTGFRCAGDAE
jgi:dimethylhistidine N-methyltransferase